MTTNDKFLAAYKQLEAELKYDEKTVLDYEGTLQSSEAEQMKCCRIMRNYMAHNDLEFLSTSNNQIKFLNEHINLIKKSAKCVKNFMKKLALSKETEQLKNLAVIVQKYGVAPMNTSKGIYLANSDTIVANYVVGNKKVNIPSKLPKYKYISPDIRIADIPLNETFIVTDDGTSKGKYLGILIN